MPRFNLLYFAALSALSATGAAAPGVKITDAQVDAITRSAILIDTHNDIPSFTVDGADIGLPGTERHTDIARLKKGGVGAVFFSAYVAANYTEGNRSANRALQMIDSIRHDIIARYPKDFMFANTADQVEEAHRKGMIAGLIGVEGGHAIEDSPRLLRDFYRLGVRYMTLTHTNTNNWADSSGDMAKAGVKHHDGLTPLGKQIILEMNRLGMMVDISHVADKTFWSALETSKAPLIASHSACRALADVPRNMTDEMIIALAKKGGVIQINFNCGFVSQRVADLEKSSPLRAQFEKAMKEYADDPEKRKAAMKEITAEARKNQVRATLEELVAHIDHVKKIAGIEAIGIGTDYDGVTCVPEQLDDVSKFPVLTRALLERGYTALEIKKIYGGNTLRLMRQVEKTAAGLQAVERQEGRAGNAD